MKQKEKDGKRRKIYIEKIMHILKSLTCIYIPNNVHQTKRKRRKENKNDGEREKITQTLKSHAFLTILSKSYLIQSQFILYSFNRMPLFVRLSKSEFTMKQEFSLSISLGWLL